MQSRGQISLVLMALRTLVFSSDERAAQVLAQHLAEFDLEPIVCPTIFSALENVGRVRFDGIIADWNDDPEATFLIKRAKETDLNRKAMVLAIVRDEAEVARAYDAGAKAVLFRPLESGEIREALTKARPFMLERAVSQQGNVPAAAPAPTLLAASSSDDEVMPIASPMVQVFAGSPQPEPPAFDHETAKSESPAPEAKRSRFRRTALVAVLIAVASPFLIRFAASLAPLRTTVRSAIHGIATTVGGSDEPAPPPPMDDSLDTSNVASSPSGHVQVVTSVGVLYEAVAHLPLRHATLPNFPLQVEKPDIPAPPPVRVSIPDSIKRSAPIEAAHPVEARPTPVMLDVVEPVSISEESARQLLVHAVDPAYPQEAMHSGIQGVVVLQALIGRDGTVRELHLMDGYFVLGRAALQAVKQWHFRPYLVNGRAVETQTILTLNFRLPVVSGVSQPGETQ
jgi:TonB family protein